MKTLSLIWALVLVSVTTNFAQQDVTTWDYQVEKTGDDEFEVIFDVTLEDKWFIYSQKLESDDGPIATTFTFDENKEIKFVGSVKEEGEKITGYDKLFEMNINKYKKHVQFVQKVKAKEGEVVKGYVSFMTCNDRQCLPPIDKQFEIELK